ncbi:cephalosporin hydroxylase [Polynucleobacter paneuropaeus]|nr:cephalosporin hydroxylase [Polynucleobacter paneuropaeus]
MDSFEKELKERISAVPKNLNLISAANKFMQESIASKYSYNYGWLGRPIIQYPQDMVAMQELIWKVKPDLIIETGIAHGGSLIMNASFLALIDYCEAASSGKSLDPSAPKRRVLGIDIDIREHNLQAIKAHPMSNHIDMIQGSSIDLSVIEQVKQYASKYKNIMVCLDSNHTHAHALAELEAYAGLTSIGSYCIVFDTVVEDMPKSLSGDRPWGPGNNPKTAVWEFLKQHADFVIDKDIQAKLMLTVAPDGYLKRIS